MQMSMLIRQLDGFHPHKIRKLRANSNSNSKLELDVVGNSAEIREQDLIHGRDAAHQENKIWHRMQLDGESLCCGLWIGATKRTIWAQSAGLYSCYSVKIMWLNLLKTFGTML